MKDRRQGKFCISMNDIDDNPGVVRHIMSKCIVTRAEMLLHSLEMEYYALSPCFEAVNPDDVIPIYIWEVNVENNVVAAKAKKVESEANAKCIKLSREPNQLPIII